MIVCLLSCHAQAVDVADINLSEIKLQEVKEIDLSSDSVLVKILEDVTDPVKYGTKDKYYTVSLEKYKGGVLVRVIASDSDIFDPRPFLSDYTLINGQLIVFQVFSDYQFTYPERSDKLSIKTAVRNDLSYITDVKYYYILDGVYARFSPEAGWLWSDGKPDE